MLYYDILYYTIHTMLYSAKLYCTMIYNILYYAPLRFAMLVLIEPHTGYDAGLPCDRVPQCDFWDSTGYTFQVGDERQQGWWWMMMMLIQYVEGAASHSSYRHGVYYIEDGTVRCYEWMNR